MKEHTPNLQLYCTLIARGCGFPEADRSVAGARREWVGCVDDLPTANIFNFSSTLLLLFRCFFFLASATKRAEPFPSVPRRNTSNRIATPHRHSLCEASTWYQLTLSRLFVCGHPKAFASQVSSTRTHEGGQHGPPKAFTEACYEASNCHTSSKQAMQGQRRWP